MSSERPGLVQLMHLHPEDPMPVLHVITLLLSHSYTHHTHPSWGSPECPQVN